jgi:hypothetical protein
MAVRNHSRVAQYDAALIVVIFSMYTLAVPKHRGHHFASMFAHLEFFDRKDWGFFHYMLAHFVLGE